MDWMKSLRTEGTATEYNVQYILHFSAEDQNSDGLIINNNKLIYHEMAACFVICPYKGGK